MSFNNSFMQEVDGHCAECGKEVRKRVPVSVARRMKILLCDSYQCKRAHGIKMNKAYRMRRAAK